MLLIEGRSADFSIAKHQAEGGVAANLAVEAASRSYPDESRCGFVIAVTQMPIATEAIDIVE